MFYPFLGTTGGEGGGEELRHILQGMEDFLGKDLIGQYFYLSKILYVSRITPY